MTGEESLRENLQQVFKLPTPAVEWLLMLWGAIQVFDDVADGDPISREDLNATIWNTLVGMNQNTFWIANSNNLAPLVGTAILKWQGSDQAERSGQADARTYGWRAGFYDLVLMAIALCHGTKAATDMSHLVMQLYGEQFEEYMKEFGNA